jgi:hypothetical protein
MPLPIPLNRPGAMILGGIAGAPWGSWAAWRAPRRHGVCNAQSAETGQSETGQQGAADRTQHSPGCPVSLKLAREHVADLRRARLAETPFG